MVWAGQQVALHSPGCLLLVPQASIRLGPLWRVRQGQACGRELDVEGTEERKAGGRVRRADLFSVKTLVFCAGFVHSV